MWIAFGLILVLNISLISSNQSHNVINTNCHIKDIEFIYIGITTVCQVSNPLNVTSRSDELLIENVVGNSTGFLVLNMEIHYIPKGIENFIRNLTVMSITSSQVKRISRENFDKYPHLRYLNLSSNEIETLDENLFDFNQNLEILILDFNKIKWIQMFVFDELSLLKYLGFFDNICFNGTLKSEREIKNKLKIVIFSCWTYNTQHDGFKALEHKINEKILAHEMKIEAHTKKSNETFGILIFSSITLFMLILMIVLLYVIKIFRNRKPRNQENEKSLEMDLKIDQKGILKRVKFEEKREFTELMRLSMIEQETQLEMRRKNKNVDEYDEIRLGNDDEIHEVRISKTFS